MGAGGRNGRAAPARCSGPAAVATAVAPLACSAVSDKEAAVTAGLLAPLAAPRDMQRGCATASLPQRLTTLRTHARAGHARTQGGGEGAGRAKGVALASAPRRAPLEGAAPTRHPLHCRGAPPRRA
jgi:hypothetical protein